MYITYLHVSFSEGQSKSMYICYDTYIARWRKGGPTKPREPSYEHGYTEEGEGKKRKRKKTKISNLKSQISHIDDSLQSSRVQ